MVKKKKFKIISIITTLFVITTLISIKGLKVKANISDKPDFDIEISVPETAIVGEDIVVKGQIIPKPFEIDIENIDTEIIMIIDRATNSNGEFNPFRNSLSNCIDDLNLNGNVKLGLIDYSIYANIFKDEDKSLFDKNDIAKAIKNLSNDKNGYSNTGEALRKAAYLMESPESDGIENKIIVLISDGSPTARTVYVDGNNEYPYIDINKENYVDAQIKTSKSEYTKDIEYAKTIGNIIKEKGYTVYTVGYNTDDNGKSVLRDIHKSMTGYNLDNEENDKKNRFYIMKDKKFTVEEIFNLIEKDILETYTINNVNMNINFTDSFSLNIGGNTVNLSNINYKLVSTSNGKAIYEADSIPFEFVIKANTVGYQKIFDKVTINYPWKDSIEKIDINKELFITVKSNELPSISAKFISKDKLEVKKDQEIAVEYEIIPEDFTSSLLSTESGKIDEAIFITDLTQTMKNNNRFSIFQNSLTNKVLNEPQLDLTKFGLIGYSDSVLVGDRNDINNPKDISMKLSNSAGNLLKPLFDISDGNSKDGFRQFFQNGYLYNSITNRDTRNINEAL